MILTDSSSAYAGSSVVKTIAGFGSNLYHFTTYGDTTLSRVVSGTGIGVLKNGSAVLTLSAANTYTGNATISAGVMSIINTGALPGYNTNGRFAVAPNATLAVYNAVTDAEITTLRGTTNFKANSNLGFDTSSGNRTYTPAIANTSQGTLGIVKLGQNTLIIPTVGTYTGSTSVLVGTLSTFGANIIPDSSPVFLDTNGTLILGGSDTLATISGRGTLNCQANNITLNSNNNSTFSGTLTSTANSGNCIYKQGTNTITLSGATARVAGPIRLDTGGITLAGNSSFIQNRTSSGPRDFQMALNGGGNTFNLTISGGASLTTAGCMFGENNGGSATVNLLSGGTWNSGSGGGSSWMAGLSSILNIDGGNYSALSFYIGGGPAGTTGIINLNSGTANLTGGTFIWQGGGRCVFNLNGGTVTFGNMSNGAVTDNTFNFNGGTFACAVGSYNYNVAVVKYIVKSGGAIFNPPSGGSITLTTSVLSADSVSTGGGLVKNGAGTLFLGGALNTFTGQVSANEGTISVTTVNNNSTNGPLGNSNFPIVLGSNGKTGTLQYTTAANAITTKGIILPSGAIGTFNITGNANNYLQLSGTTISGSGSLVKTGIGAMAYGPGNSTYSGGTTLIEGTNLVGSDTAFGTGTVNFNGGGMRSYLNEVTRTLSNSFILSALATFPTGGGERTLILAGPVTMTRQVTLDVGVGATVTTEALIISGPIGDGGNAYQLDKTGAGVLVLSGQNTFSGPIIIQAGNMRILYPTIGDIRTTVGILQFAAGITNDISSSIRNNTQSVKIDTNGQNVTFASLLSSNSAGLVKTGTGTLILSATPIGTNTNAVRGSIISNAGTLSITGTLSSASRMAVSDVGGSTTGAITVSGTLIQTTGATGIVRALQIAAPAGTSGTFNVVSGGNVAFFSGCMLGDNGGGNGTFNMTGGTVTTNGQFWFAGANSTLTVSGGILNSSSTMYLGGGGGTTTSTLTIAGGTISTPSNLNFGIGGATSTMNVNLNGGTFSCVTFEYNQGTATVNMNGGILSFTGAGNTPLASQLIFSVKSGGAIIDIPTLGRVVTIPSVLANGTGGGGLTKTGVGKLILQGANAYTGPTVVSAGTIELSGSSALLGGATSTVISVSAGATLDLASKSKTVSNVSIDSGGIVKNATLVLSNATVNIGSSTSLNNIYLYNSTASTLNNTSGSTIVLDSTNSFGLATSTLILSGSNIDAGSCVTDFSGAANTIPSVNVDSSTFTIGRVNASQVNRTFTKNGNGTLRFANIDNTSTWLRTQTTILAAGTLEIHDGRNLGAPIATTSYYLRIDNNSTLRFINSSYSTWPINSYTSYSISILSLGTTLSADVSNADFAMFTGITGGGALCKVGSGKLIFTAANAYGSTIINSGTLELSASGNLGGTGGTNQPFTMNGGILNLGTKSQGVAALTINGGTIQNGTLTMSSNLSGSITGGTVTAVVGGTNAWLIKSGTGTTATLSAVNTYTGYTSITDGTLRVSKKISGTGSDASFTKADFTSTTLEVTFVSGTPPSVGNTFRLFPGATLQTYSTVTLVNYAGTASYNSTNSTLTINT